MHINITTSETGDNKGSSSRLVTYLEKENRLAEQLDKYAKPEYWFSHGRDNIRPYEVRSRIDNNVAKLSKTDAKFFLVNISPSGKELAFLKERFGEEGAREKLKMFANRVMDAYAKNFKRAGIDDNADLVYFGKLEQYRYYSFRDMEVRNGRAKRGERKPGEQLHVQVIVSRKDATNSIKLSPLNNSKGKNAAHSEKVGQFDRVAFKQAAESLFDETFGYQRELEETFRYANTMKRGSYAQKELIRQQRVELRSAIPDMDVGGKSLVEVLLVSGEERNNLGNDFEWRRKRKKRKKGWGYRP